MGWREERGERRERNERKEKRRGIVPMSEILKNTLIAELI